jgi:RNA polymerase sigma-70 factor (ECF subfamily)
MTPFGFTYNLGIFMAAENPIAIDEATLIRRSRGGDREAFGRLVERYQAPVYRIVRGIVGDPAESEDVAQEIFLKAYANLARFRGESSFFTWLYRIAVNEALRAAKRRSFAPVPMRPEAQAPPPEPEEEEAPTLPTLQGLLRQLSEDFRAIVTLRDLEALSYREISETLGIPIGTVESRLFRARQELRTLWRKMKEARNAL